MKKAANGMVTLGDLMTKLGLKMPVTTVFLHQDFHTDEAVCWWMSRSASFFGNVQEVFPGIEKADSAFWSLGQMLAVEERADTLSFGCRGGRADEHKLVSEDYEKTCAADMFARIANLRADAALSAVITKVLTEDRMGKSAEGSLHAVLKFVHRMDDASRPESMKILEWVAMAYEAEYQAFKKHEALRQENPPLTVTSAKSYIKEFFGTQTAEEWADLPNRAKKNARERMGRMLDKLSDDRALGSQSKYWTTVPCMIDGKREKVPMMVMTTESMEAKEAALKLGATIIIIRRASGNTGVFTDRRKCVDLTTVALALRTKELELIWDQRLVLKKPMFGPEELDVRGDVKGWPSLTPYWYLHDTPWRDGHGRPFTTHLYNGSESAQVMPTLISLEVVVTIVKVILGGQFHPGYYRNCIQGKCAGESCPWFHWGLGRCHDAQQQTFAAK